MANFMIRFLICNIFISAIIGILLAAKRFFKGNLSSRMQYNLWYLLLGLLAVPFIPFRPIGFTQIFSWLNSLKGPSPSNTGMIIGEAANRNPTETANWMNDFTLSVSTGTPSTIGLMLCGIWFVGILAMVILVIKSSLRLRKVNSLHFPSRI